MADDAMDLVSYRAYKSSDEVKYLPLIRALIARDLSEPYSIYVYRYFLYQWTDISFMALVGDALVGVIICKLEAHAPKGQEEGPMRGYIAMLAVQEEYRNKGIAKTLVNMAIEAMKERGADEVVLETEITNEASLKLYQRLNFIRSKKLHRYYLNGNAAYRLMLNLKEDQKEHLAT